MAHVTTESELNVRYGWIQGLRQHSPEGGISVNTAQLFQLLAPLPGEINASHVVLVPWGCYNDIPQTEEFYKQPKFISHSSGDGKSGVGVPVW